LTSTAPENEDVAVVDVALMNCALSSPVERMVTFAEFVGPIMVELEIALVIPCPNTEEFPTETVLLYPNAVEKVEEMLF
jgi:hypothetical protein